MDNWKVEIKRLDNIRLELGLNFNQLEKLSGSNRQKIGRMFQMVNEPSLSFYLTIKSVLENHIKVVLKEKKETSASAIDKKLPKVKVGDGVGNVLKTESPCDCRMSGTLFIRAKGCTKSKDEHKF